MTSAIREKSLDFHGKDEDGMNHTRTHKTVRSLLVWLLLLTMVFGLLPMAAFADETVVEPVVSEEPVQETEPSEPTEAPSEPTQEPTQEPEPEQPGDADVTIEGDEKLEEAALTNNTVELKNEWLNPSPSGSYTGDFMKIFFLDCGRKYFSVDNIKKLIDNASAAGFNYIQLAVGNDGLRFLLDDMSLTVNGTTYTTEQVSAAIHAGNNSYHYFPVDALTQSQMDTIIAYAKEKKMGVIPCVNTPGHMDAILSAASSLTVTNCSYYNSARTIDVTNATAVEFTQALLQKYISYFKGQGCKFFNMGADEYANDIYTGGSMGFGNLQSTGKYSYYVQYVNQVADIIKTAGMTPMAFNDGIYFNNNTSSGTFNTGILICYWSSCWSGYSPMPASALKGKHFSLVNTNGSYYWVLGKADAQCSAEKAAGFDKTAFPGSTISDPSGAMFCIWCDYPDAEKEADVVSKTAATIAAFGKALSNTPTTGGGSTGGGETGDGVINLKVGEMSSEIATTESVGAQTTGDSNIATASVTKGTATEKTLKEITSASELSADKQYLIVNIRKNAVLTATTSQYNAGSYIRPKYYNVLQLSGKATPDNSNIWKIEPSGTGYTVKYSSNNTYLNIGENTDYLNSTPVALTIEYKNNVNYKGWYISYNGAYLNALGNENGAGGWKDKYAVDDIGSNWRIYEIVEPSSSNVLTFTGTGEGTTTANIGDVDYTIKVTARESTETKTLNFGESFALPEGVEEVTIDGNAVTRNGSSIVAGDTVDTATVTAVVKNAGGKVTDRYTYNISVTDQAPDGSMTSDTITLEHWITNAKVGSTSGATDNTQTIANTYEGITSADGVEISTFARNPGYWENTPVTYWQAMRLDSAHKQTGDNGVDMTSKGTALTHIRYSNAWQYKTADGVWHYFQSDDQLVAYYLQKTEVTKEITTFTKDWGFGTSGTTDYNREGQVALSVAVVYPDGQLSPTEDNIYSQSTTIFNFWTNRDIGIVAPVNNSDYNISKITVTDGARASNTTANQWYANDTITWEKETTASGGRWYKETEVWKKSDGTTPMVNGAASNIRWSEKNTAKLILIYLEPVEKDTNLEIVYYDDTAKREIKSYQVSMTYTGQTVPTFDTALMQGNQPIGGTKDWPGKTALDTGYLPDDAYVLNSANIKETFNKNLTELTGIADNYKSGIYEYNGANISEDGKTLTLHYQVKAFENSKTIVVDFGLPVEVTGLLNWFNVTDSGTVKDISLATGTSLYDSVGTYGRAVINTETWNSLTYTLQKLIDAEITIPLHLNFKSGGQQQQRQLKVIPATSVYYEDSFVGEGFKNGTGAANDAMWKLAGTEETAKQALSELGSKDIYGNDKAYENSSKFSMGSAKTVTVNSGMLTNWNETSAWPTATFTFKGTGFDIISLTNNQSGAIIVSVSKNGNAVKNLLVDNYYGYTKNENGEWVVNNNVANCLYQIPVIQVRGLDYGEYTVEVKVFYNDAFNQTAGSSYSFWFDGFRVYDPMGKDNSIYTKDDEGYPQYIKLRDALLNNSASAPQMLFIDGAANAGVAEYKNYGPNNEVYLAGGQAISFRLAGNASIATIQIGAKSPNASDTVKLTMSVKINNTTLEPKEIGTATEMYYKISESGADAQQVTITNTGDAILSLTNIKITYSVKSTTELAALAESDEQAAVAAVRALYAAPEVEPVESFKPEHFEAKWSNNVRQGGRAVLTVKTSADVEQIIINGDIVVSNYKTRTERVGYGWNAERVTYHVFTYMISAQQSAEYSVVAVNGDGVMSEAVTARLTVRPKGPIKDWFDGLFGGWF